ncbi:hypothetical protein [Clostridium sp. OS1-26]|nr:hypothetical protein [Clostridium sp. OS1-26]WML36044.1 hypothetical protein RCG18_04800 [Clostridium sp. OS1-26]
MYKKAADKYDINSFLILDLAKYAFYNKFSDSIMNSLVLFL